MIQADHLLRHFKYPGFNQDRRLWGIVFFIIIFVQIGFTANQVDLTEISLEELMRIEVTLASRHSERFTDAATAIYVLTQEDIIQSGHTSIPEALRMIPGMEVGRIDANKWGVTVRGFNNLFANKLLVLMDGRTIYNPIFSGVVWDAQDVIFEDIEQIEVVRGPGGSLWGSNALNGVINIVTRSAEDTQGGYVTLGGGTEEKAFGAFRYGGTFGKMHYRIYTKYINRSEYIDQNSEPMADAWHMWKTGLRIDGKLTDQDLITILSEYYQNKVGQTLYIQEADYTYTRDFQNQGYGGYLLGRWHRQFSDRSQWKIQAYFDTFKRQEFLMIGGQHYTIDIDFQYNHILQSHNLIVGGGLRETWDKFNNSSYIRLVPNKKNYYIINAFIQDDKKIFNDRWHLILGSKFEYNFLSGWEIQPNLRWAYHLDEEGLLWAGISRAVRTPARIDQDMTSNFVIGNPSVKSEELWAYEIGGRYRPVKSLYLDITAYYHHYDRLLTYEPLVAMNKKQGHITGIELAMDFQAFFWMKMRSGYSYGNCAFRLDQGSQDPYSQNMDREMPRHQFFSQAIMKINQRWQWTVNLRYVGRLSGTRIHTDAYLNLHSRIAYRPLKDIEFAFIGQNLLQPHHTEFNADWIPFKIADVPRGFYAQWKWWF